MEKKVIKKQNQGRNCIVCGVDNESGLHGEFFELEDGTLVGLFHLKPWHQSYPGRVHGGIITAMLDETIGRAVQIADPDAWGVTAELTTRYLKPVPYDTDLRVTGRITRDARLLFIGEGEVLLPDGTVAARATAKYAKLPLASIGDLNAEGDSWENYPKDTDPAYIDLPEIK